MKKTLVVLALGSLAAVAWAVPDPCWVRNCRNTANGNACERCVSRACGWPGDPAGQQQATWWCRNKAYALTEESGTR